MLFRSPRGWILLRIFQQWNGTVICLKRNGRIAALSHNRRKASKNGMDIWAIDSDPRFDEFDLFFRGLRTRIRSMSGLLRRSRVFYLIFGKSQSCSSLTSLVTQRASIEYISLWASGVGWRKKEKGSGAVLKKFSLFWYWRFSSLGKRREIFSLIENFSGSIEKGIPTPNIDHEAQNMDSYRDCFNGSFCLPALTRPLSPIEIRLAYSETVSFGGPAYLKSLSEKNSVKQLMPLMQLAGRVEVEWGIGKNFRSVVLHIGLCSRGKTSYPIVVG